MTTEKSEESNSSDEYKVGPGHPPLEHRFVKGKSGNPDGLSKRKDKNKTPKSYADQIMEVLDQPIEATIKGKRKQISKLTYAINGLIKAAGLGKASAGTALLRLVEFADKRLAKAEEIDTEHDQDAAFLREKLEQMARRQSEALGLPAGRSIAAAYLELQAKLAERDARDQA